MASRIMKSMLSLDGRFLYLEDFRWLLDGHCQFSLKQKETNLSVETYWLHCQVHNIKKENTTWWILC